MRSKRITFILLVVLCACIIFTFSNQVGKTSEGISDSFTIKIIATYAKITKKEISENRKKELVKDTRKLIRKSAHFTIYLLLGIFMYATLKCYNCKHPVIYSILFCFLYACSDEIHQLFVSERTGRVFDVFIDTCGASVGISLVLFFKRLFGKKFS